MQICRSVIRIYAQRFRIFFFRVLQRHRRRRRSVRLCGSASVRSGGIGVLRRIRRSLRPRAAADFFFHYGRRLCARGRRGLQRNLANDQRPHFIKKIHTPGIEFERFAHLLDGTGGVSRSIERPRQRAIRLGFRWRKTNSLARGARRLLRIALRHIGVGHIDVRLKEIRTKIERGSELFNCGIDLFLREQNPAQRVVSIRTARLNCDNPLEVRFRSSKITLLQRSDSLPIDRIRLLGGVLRSHRERSCKRGDDEGTSKKRRCSRENGPTIHPKIVTRKSVPRLLTERRQNGRLDRFRPRTYHRATP